MQPPNIMLSAPWPQKATERAGRFDASSEHDVTRMIYHAKKSDTDKEEGGQVQR